MNEIKLQAPSLPPLLINRDGDDVPLVARINNVKDEMVLFNLVPSIENCMRSLVLFVQKDPQLKTFLDACIQTNSLESFSLFFLRVERELSKNMASPIEEETDWVEISVNNPNIVKCVRLINYSLALRNMVCCEEKIRIQRLMDKAWLDFAPKELSQDSTIKTLALGTCTVVEKAIPLATLGISTVNFLSTPPMIIYFFKTYALPAIQHALRKKVIEYICPF